jgi:hypothetical protein
MNVDDQVRELCDRALSSRDPAEVSEMILSQVRALLHEHVARIRKLVAERRRRSELEQPSDIAYGGTSFSCPMLASPHQRRNETEQNKRHEHHHITSRTSIACDHARGLDAVGRSQRRYCFGD